MSGVAFTSNQAQIDALRNELMPRSDNDTQGNPVPVNKAHAYTYDTSGNLATDTVTDGTSTWVRTYLWNSGAQTSDSGWVKQ